MDATSCSIRVTLPTRLVSRRKSKFSQRLISLNRSERHAGSTSLSNTSARLAQNTRGLVPVRAASAFHFKGWRQFASLVRRRGWPLPHFT